MSAHIRPTARRRVRPPAPVAAQMSKRERRDALNEIFVLSKLNHPNIIKYHESYEQKNILFIVMEYADGGLHGHPRWWSGVSFPGGGAVAWCG